MALEQHFDPAYTAILAQREKQIQQNYRPIIGIHKWFARRPGTVFRSLLLAEFNGTESLETAYWRAHEFRGVIADPFMGGGTPIFEANRLGFGVVGTDINPMAYWIVRQSLAAIDLKKFSAEAAAVISEIETEIGQFYRTRCIKCQQPAEVKYFLWVKEQACPHCKTKNDLFPGYLLAESVRHPKNVLVCASCGHLNEYTRKPTAQSSQPCAVCRSPVQSDGPAWRQNAKCRTCGKLYPYPEQNSPKPPQHRMWALEYHCSRCKPRHSGRFFKKPDEEDLTRYEQASELLGKNRRSLPIPETEILAGDETDRLHRWGYRYFYQLFNDRQLLGLGLLMRKIEAVQDSCSRHALLTVFSDFLRYQNMLCRYDTYALKCQDIFSVHGFPVGLVQCEDSLLGIPKIGSGSFRHFVEKYWRAKQYCEAPFETREQGHWKEIVPIRGERIAANMVDHFPSGTQQAYLRASSAADVELPPNSLDGVFTDPPYYDNVQYAELIDFCFCWLRLALKKEFEIFSRETTRTAAELTGNATLGRGIEHFTDGLSKIFQHYAKALKLGAPFVFTYHHNDPLAYVPLVVATLDAGLDCTTTFLVPAEMGASLHIVGTKSSTLDTVFVCRGTHFRKNQVEDFEQALSRDIRALADAGMKLSSGDIRCLISGHSARATVNKLRAGWVAERRLSERMGEARTTLLEFSQVMKNSLVPIRPQKSLSTTQSPSLHATTV